jgi:hypothetical protein
MNFCDRLCLKCKNFLLALHSLVGFFKDLQNTRQCHFDLQVDNLRQPKKDLENEKA